MSKELTTPEDWCIALSRMSARIEEIAKDAAHIDLGDYAKQLMKVREEYWRVNREYKETVNRQRRIHTRLARIAARIGHLIAKLRYGDVLLGNESDIAAVERTIRRRNERLRKRRIRDTMKAKQVSTSGRPPKEPLLG